MDKWEITRRDLLRSSVVGISAITFAGCQQLAGAKRPLRFGMVTDSHYADSEPRDNRYYRESIDKMSGCVDLMNKQQVDFLIELGDFKDQDSNPVEEQTIEYLKTIEKTFQRFNGPTYHVLGNHDMDSISKEQFLKNITNTGIANQKTYYSFNQKGIHFIVLDANFLEDGTAYDHGNFDWTQTYIPQKELQWLEQDMNKTSLPVIVFCHQQLGRAGDTCVRNAQQVRNILQRSGKVLAVFNGHEHNGGLVSIEGIHYYTLRAVVDGMGSLNNSYAIVEVLDNSDIIVTGYLKAQTCDLKKS